MGTLTFAMGEGHVCNLTVCERVVREYDAVVKRQPFKIGFRYFFWYFIKRFDTTTLLTSINIHAEIEPFPSRAMFTKVSLKNEIEE